MNRYFRIFLFGVCVVQFIFAAGYVFQLPFATRLWPLDYTSNTTFIFIGSIYAAAAASTLWALWMNEPFALAGIALDYAAIFLPVAVFAWQVSGGRGALGIFAVVGLAAALFGLALLWWSARQPIRDPRPTPSLVRWAYVLFVITLVVVGGALVLKSPNLLPWDVPVTGQVIYGWMFLGAAAYFAFGAARPRWANAGGQLAGFLAYDIILIIPFVLMFSTVEAARLPNLIIYLIVVVGSGLLALYYLFLHPATRGRTGSLHSSP
jgi:hypothetical protein